MTPYEIARERYAELGVDTDEALIKLSQVPISLHCWQGDDVGGFEDPARGLSGGIMTTGNNRRPICARIWIWPTVCSPARTA